MSRRPDSLPDPNSQRILNGVGSVDVAGLAREIARAAARVERKTLRLEEAAECLGVSIDFFTAHIAPDLKVIRKGRLRLVPVAEIDRWIEEQATHVFPK
jgi:hypothetical protein